MDLVAWEWSHRRQGPIQSRRARWIMDILEWVRSANFGRELLRPADGQTL